mgnify:CR=1 FL=1
MSITGAIVAFGLIAAPADIPTGMLASFGVGQFVWSLFWLALFVLYFVLVYTIVADIFASDLSGPGKGIWTLAVLVLPFFGALLYLIVRGDNLTSRLESRFDHHEQAVQDYIRDTAATSADPAADREQLRALYAAGQLTDDEFAAATRQLRG